MARVLILAFTLMSLGCSAVPRVERTPSHVVSATDQGEVQVLLEQLYRSFNYGAGQEPDWRLMRTLFVDGAQFVPEPSPGAPLRSYDVDALIAKWQSSMRAGSSPNLGYSEWIGNTSVDKVGELLRVDVLFYGKEPGDSHPREPGLDSLLLARVNGSWKVLSFIVHNESKL
jgi:hypothetical protein